MPVDAPGKAVLDASKVHLVGIGGTGMQALAEVLLARGVTVTGSDSLPSPALERISVAGARTFVGHVAGQLGDAQAVVVSAAVPDENEELREARRRGIPVATHAQVLGALSAASRTIAIAGTHGKSTTTALTAHLLTQAGHDPVVLGGAFAPDLGGSGRAGRGSALVVEADEFARRFLQLTPSVAVVTNLEPDHLDYYGSFSEIEDAFVQFLDRVRPGGTIFVCGDVPISPKIVDRPEVQRYGFSEACTWRVSGYVPTTEGATFNLEPPDGSTHLVQSRLRGPHNALNAAAAIAAAGVIHGSLAGLAALVGSFSGARRRFDTVARSSDFWIVDDYAHHPTELRATLRAARESHAGRIWAIFQPHTSHRTKALFSEFTSAFGDADEVVILPIYHPPGREPEQIPISSDELTGALMHPRAQSSPSMEATLDLLRRSAMPGDLILTLGAGDVTSLAPLIADALGARC